MGFRFARLSAFVLFVASLAAQQRATPQEFKQAELEAPQLAGVMDLKPGMTIADVGAGFGAMTVALSQWVGPTGRVYAIDVTPSALADLRAEVEERKLGNVTVVEGTAGSANLPDGCCDAVLLAHVYHHLTQPDAINQSILRALVGRALTCYGFRTDR
jgi:ubiquinone/menaquinone biosynthesis C-methylase UbiE